MFWYCLTGLLDDVKLSASNVVVGRQLTVIFRCYMVASFVDGYFLMLYGRELNAVIVAYHVSLDPFL